MTTSASTTTTVEVERVLSLRDAIELTGLSRDELQRHARNGTVRSLRRTTPRSPFRFLPSHLRRGPRRAVPEGEAPMIRQPRPVPRHGKRVSFRRPTDIEVRPRRAATSSASTPTHPTTIERNPS